VPEDPEQRAEAVDYLADQVREDREFGRKLQELARSAGIVEQRIQFGDLRVESRSGGTSVGQQQGSGNVGRDKIVRNREYRIGSLHFGTGGLVGIILLVMAALGGGTAATVAAVQGQSDAQIAYQQQVLGTCTNLQEIYKSDLGDYHDGSHNVVRSKLVAALNGDAQDRTQVLNSLWQQPVPANLTGQADAARRAADEYLSLERRIISEFYDHLPDSLSDDQLQAAESASPFGDQGVAARLKLLNALTALAGHQCPIT